MESRKLEEEKISKLLWEYCIPALLGASVFILYNIIDRMFISYKLGRLAIAGTSITLPIFTFILAVSLFIGVGSGIIISISLGEKNREKAEKTLGMAMFLFIFVGIFFSIFGLLYLDNILKLFGATKENLSYAREYMKSIFLLVPFQFMAIGLNNILRGEGSPKVAMKMNIIGAIINIILDPILMFEFNLGIKGAAFATIIANVVVAILQIRHFLGRNCKIKLKKEFIKLDSIILKEISKIGISPLIMQFSSSLVVIFINKNLNIYGGNLGIAAFGIINSFNTLTYMPIVGIYQGSQPILGYNYGARKYLRVREAYIKSLEVAFFVTLAGYIIIMFFPHYLLKPFIKNDIELERITLNGIKIIFSTLFLLGINSIGTSYFQSIGRAWITMALSLYKQIFLILGLLYILPKKFGIDGVWLVIPVTEILTFTVVIIFILKEIKRLKKMQ